MVATAEAWVLCMETLMCIFTRWPVSSWSTDLVNTASSQRPEARELGGGIKGGLGEAAAGTVQPWQSCSS